MGRSAPWETNVSLRWVRLERRAYGFHVRLERRGDMQRLEDAVKRCGEIGRLRVVSNGCLAHRNILHEDRLEAP